MPHPATKDFGDPDLTGYAGDAWMMDLPLKRKTPDGNGTLAAWQMTIPGAHLCWHSYALSVVHLRPIEGARPAVLHYPEAAYELVLLALDPDQPLSDPKKPDFRLHFLSPSNLTIQLHGITDGQAQGLARALTAEFVYGRLNPDTDYRTWQLDFIAKYLERFGGVVGWREN